MENNMNDIYKIKVNKNQNILNNNNSNSNLNSNIIPILNEEIPTSNFIRKIVLSKFKNRNRHNNDYFENVQNHKDIYKEMPNKLSKSYKDLRRGHNIFEGSKILNLSSSPLTVVYLNQPFSSPFKLKSRNFTSDKSTVL